MITDLADFQKFAIGFDPRDKKKVFEYWDEIFSNQRWTEGKFTKLFEEKWAAWNGVEAVATSSWTGAAMACMEYFGLGGRTVLCPTNTFMMTPLAAIKSNAKVVVGDSNREDLCLSYDPVVSVASQHYTAAEWLGHVR